MSEQKDWVVGWVCWILPFFMQEDAAFFKKRPKGRKSAGIFEAVQNRCLFYGPLLATRSPPPPMELNELLVFGSPLLNLSPLPQPIQTL
jgi:hypothetical protein